MKIAVLNWRDASHPRAGGAEVYVHEIARRWIQDGHDVTVFSSSVAGRPSAERVDDVSVVRVGSLSRGTHHLRAPAAVRSHGPDVILESVNTIPYQLPRRRSMPPFLPLVHQMALDVWDAHVPRPVASLLRRIEPHLFAAYRSTRVACASPSTQHDLAGAGVHDTVVVPEGGLGPRPFPRKEESPTVLFVGRLAANKRPDHAVEAFRLLKSRIPDARMWVVGEGPMRGLLVRTLPPGVELLGRLSPDELIDRMGRAHLLFATSVREGWGLAVTEANAVGTPAVAYDVPGLRDSVLDGSTGVLTDPRPTALSEKAVSLLRDPQRYEALRRAAAAWGARHDWSRTAAELLSLLEGARSGHVVAR